ncbi:efflux transporter outer membrane subunit [Ketobacter sp. MCCC 1A13808]|uniref:efflux transporter outer membrane subunit n=1 Tax=Ketobacter sp. MCCC 1A13808 TaxID=2602738 RepID=UPI0012EBC840|nr:efflux transporter outer membrane subunit [Ketobacter sp. MCCC 1A13808]MVF12075.1 efflux transporter outer membrane subunit [Ketobacter sp. MCCC 1A13808]
MFKLLKPISGLTLTAVLLQGCMVGPDYKTPDSQPPATFYNEPESPTPEKGGNSPQQNLFWQGFDDPVLAQLITETLSANYDLRAALANYDRAASLLRGAKRNRLPNIAIGANAGEQHLALSERAPPAYAERVEQYNVDASLSWELDLFGRLRRSVEQQQGLLDATAADLDALQIALVGQMATQYFELRGLQQQMQVAQHNLELQRESLDIVDTRVNAGRGTEFDQVRAQAQWESTGALLPLLRADIAAHMHRIAVLSGQLPGELNKRLATQVNWPTQLPSIPLDSPGDVLRRRPDIRAAERRLAANTAAIGVATADWFPRFQLGGLIGSFALDADDLFSASAEHHGGGIGIQWAALDFGRVQARVDSANAEAQAALAQYQQTLLVALEETETQLVRYQQEQQRSQRLNRASDAAEQAAKLARSRYEQGYIGFFEVLAAEQELIQTQAQLVQSRTQLTLAMVNLYRAMAGPPQQS